MGGTDEQQVEAVRILEGIAGEVVEQLPAALVLVDAADAEGKAAAHVELPPEPPGL